MDEKNSEKSIDVDETTDPPSNCSSNLTRRKKGRRISLYNSLPQLNSEDNFLGGSISIPHQVESNGNPEDDPELTTVFENLLYNWDKGKEYNCLVKENIEQQLDYILAQNKMLRRRVNTLRDYENRITSFRKLYEDVSTYYNQGRNIICLRCFQLIAVFSLLLFLLPDAGTSK